MKFFATLFALAAVACVVLADKTDKKEGMVASSYGAAPSYGGAAPSYGGAAPSYSAPPCPKNYLFSCQPSLAPVPCAAGGGYGGGAVGAYSEQVPQYLLPQYAYQQYAPQY